MYVHYDYLCVVYVFLLCLRDGTGEGGGVGEERRER